MHLPVRPGTDVVVALAVANWLFANGGADEAFLAQHANGVAEFRRRAAEWPIARAAEVAGLDPDRLTEFAKLYAESSPAVVRCGWGIERNRNGGSGIAAVLALPAVAGKFGVRGGGYTMSNTPSWDLKADAAAQEACIETRLVNMIELGKVLTEPLDPPIKGLFVYNANPVASTPNQRKILDGLKRDDLFVVVHEQVMTDTAVFADVLLPATTFLEHDELSKGYGALILNRSAPVADPVGEARSNVAVFAELCARMNLAKPGDVTDPAELARMILRSSSSAAALVAAVGDAPGSTAPPCGPNPIQFVDVFPRTASGKIELVAADLDAEAPGGLHRYRPPPVDKHPLTLVSPATAKTVSSTLAQLWKEPAEVVLHPADADARGLATGASVRVFNDLGEVVCKLRVGDEVRPGVALMHKGYWRRHTENGFTSTSLTPDGLTDLGGGACFNDARVEVAAWRR
jgi:anaerobic selenocysteine-containing dehydrogenase